MRAGLLLEEALRTLGAVERRLTVPPPAPAWADALRRPGERRTRPSRVASSGLARSPIAEWQAVRAGERPRLGRRAIRYLCWEPAVATDPAFHVHLDRLGVTLDLRALQGLLRSCHARWSPALLVGAALERVQARILAYPGGARLADRLAERWRRDLRWLLGPEGPQELAGRLLASAQPVRLACREWALDPQTAFVREAVRLAVGRWRARLGADSDQDRTQAGRLLGWRGWDARTFRAEVAGTLLGMPAGARVSRAALLRFVLDDARLGDPRHGASAAAWRLMDAAAARRVVTWIADDDLDLFYGRLVPRSDAAPRRQFWQRQLPAIRFSRVLLNLEDELRWMAEPSAASAPAPELRFARVFGPDSVLLLALDRALVVERARGRTVEVYARDTATDLIAAVGAGGEATARALDRPRVRVAEVSLDDAWPAALAGIVGEYGSTSALASAGWS